MLVIVKRKCPGKPSDCHCSLSESDNIKSCSTLSLAFARFTYGFDA